MAFTCLIVDYDGTLVTEGPVAPAVLQALHRLQAAGWTLVLATGRILTDLETVFPHLDMFARVVAENGAVVYRPETKEEVILAAPPPVQLIDALRQRKVEPLGIGRVIIGTEKPQDVHVLEVIRELGLERSLIFNKRSVMVLPSGINKATGLGLALQGLRLTFEQAVGVGDAENDHAFLKACGFSVALDNAVDSLKAQVHLVMPQPNGLGVEALIDKLLKESPARV